MLPHPHGEHDAPVRVGNLYRPRSATQIRRPVRTRCPVPLQRRHGRQFRPFGDMNRAAPLHLRQAVNGHHQHATAYPPNHTSTTKTVTNVNTVTPPNRGRGEGRGTTQVAPPLPHPLPG